MTELRHLTSEKTVALPSDLLFIQSPSESVGSKITVANLATSISSGNSGNNEGVGYYRGNSEPTDVPDGFTWEETDTDNWSTLEIWRKVENTWRSDVRFHESGAGSWTNYGYFTIDPNYAYFLHEFRAFLYLGNSLSSSGYIDAILQGARGNVLTPINSLRFQGPMTGGSSRTLSILLGNIIEFDIVGQDYFRHFWTGSTSPSSARYASRVKYQLIRKE
jgi:hypothetical protein